MPKAPSIPPDDLVEIKETQPDNAPNNEIPFNEHVPVKADGFVSNLLPARVPLLVDRSILSTFCANNSDFVEILSACTVEITLNPELFWHRIVQQPTNIPSENEHDGQSHVILVDAMHDNVLMDYSNHDTVFCLLVS
jgi:hypothetical protein